MRVLTLVGARPQFVKASMLSRAFKKYEVEEILVHSGQHYDKKISHVFFEELQIPEPAINLGVGSASHAKQTGEIMIRIESFVDSIKPVSCMVVYGDTNTTLAGALYSSKTGIPLVHIEAGLRSFNLVMPEEVNRIITDRLSDFLFCPTLTSMKNLQDEGIKEKVYLSGDVMYDATVHFSEMAITKKSDFKTFLNQVNSFYLTTIHRPSNTDNKEQLLRIIEALSKLDHPVLFPVHPRTKVKLEQINLPDNIKTLPPVSYLEMLLLIQRAKAVITDSGGLQKEAYWLKKPCITLRKETEWVETLEGNWNQLADLKSISLEHLVKNIPKKGNPQALFGKANNGGFASDYITQTLLANL